MDAPSIPPDPDVRRPAGLSLEERNVEGTHCLVLRRSAEIVLPIFLWDIAVSVMCVLSFVGSGLAGQRGWWWFTLVAGALYLAYSTLVHFNRSEFRLNRKRFLFVHRPVPELGRLCMDTSGIERFVATQATGGFLPRPSGSKWAVAVLDRSNVTHLIRLRFHNSTHSDYVAARLNSLLRSVREPTGYRE